MSVTTRAQALEILRNPKFGDPLCCEAVAWLEAFEELATIREANRLGKKYECPCCHGTGETLCSECGNHQDCHTCDGMGAWATVEEWEKRVYLKCFDAGDLRALKARISELKAILDS